MDLVCIIITIADAVIIFIVFFMIIVVFYYCFAIIIISLLSSSFAFIITIIFTITPCIKIEHYRQLKIPWDWTNTKMYVYLCIFVMNFKKATNISKYSSCSSTFEINMFKSSCFALRDKKRKKKKEKRIRLVYGEMHLSTYIRYIHPVFIHGHTYTLSLTLRPVTLSLSLSALSLLTLFPL